MLMRSLFVTVLLLISVPLFAQMTGTVTGTVTDGEGQPLDSVYVILHDDDHHGGGGGGGGGMMGDYETWTDVNGSFTIEEVAVGDYEARAMLFGFGMDAEDVTVVANQTVTVDLELEFGGGGGGHGGGFGMHEWEEVTLAGWTIVIENDFHDMFYLDEENDGEAEWHLGFGPPDYVPPGDLQLPEDGDQIDITGGLMMMGGWGDDLPMVMVFTLNGETWFEPDSMGGQHNGHGGDWHQDHDCDFEHPGSGMAEGWVMMDMDADDHNMYWLDTDDDNLADLRLSYGSHEYSPGNGAMRPQAGDWAELIGGMIEGCPQTPTLVVYQHNGMFWREPGDTTGLGPLTLGVGDDNTPSIPNDYLVVSAYPNPFNAETTVTAVLPEQAELTITVFDVLGRTISDVNYGLQSAGAKQFTIDASSWAAGIYMVRVEAGSASEMVKVQFVK